MINIFSIFKQNDKIELNVTPLSVKFNCKFCNKTNIAVIAYVEIAKVVFDIANADNRASMIWHCECSFCNKRNEIHFIAKHYEEEYEKAVAMTLKNKKMEVENGKL